MIISHEHRFIFVKTRKTAGTSLEIALSRYCGPRDVITPMLPDDEVVRAQHNGRAPQHYKRPLRDYTLYDWRRLILDRNRQDFREHMFAHRMRRMLSRKVWNGYFKFAVERNPWDKVVSGYYWGEALRKRNGLPPLTLAEFVASNELNRALGWPRYTENDEIILDAVIRYEDLDKELPALSERLGLPALSLPNAKTGHRTDKRPYRELLDSHTRETIARKFSKEIEHFGYTF